MEDIKKEPSMRVLKWLFLVIDLSFIMYFGATSVKLIPVELAYSDYTNPILVAWNWSFFPLDMAISITGLSAIYLHKRGCVEWKGIAFISLVLTFCSGLMAISYWAIREEIDFYPLFFIPRFLKV